LNKQTGKAGPTKYKKPKKLDLPTAGVYFIGATHLLDKIREGTGIAKRLKSCCGGCSGKILSLAYFLVLGEGDAAYKFSKWSRFHKHPCKVDLASQRISEIFADVQPAQWMEFFKLQIEASGDDGHWAYDSTSLSSCSVKLKEVKRGKSKDDPRLEILNLAMVSGEKPQLPLYYRKYAGNTVDSKTLTPLVTDMRPFGAKS
jgi:hypothetical protein